MKKSLPAFARLCIIALLAAVMLAVTNAVTIGPIEETARATTNVARKQVLAIADDFEQLTLPEGSAADSLYTGKKGDEIVGYTAAATVQGSQGPVEVTVGIDATGAITGLSVGGSKFAETAGLGTKCQEPSFTNQFIGLVSPISLGKGVDAISGATVTSTAVVKGANAACQAIFDTTGLVPTATPDTTSAATSETAQADATTAATGTAATDATTAATGTTTTTDTTSAATGTAATTSPDTTTSATGTAATADTTSAATGTTVTSTPAPDATTSATSTAAATDTTSAATTESTPAATGEAK